MTEMCEIINQFAVKNNLYGASSALTTIINMVAVSTFYWIHDQDENIGLFLKKTNGGNIAVTDCASFMSATECVYLSSTKIASIITILFGGFNTIFYCLPYLPIQPFFTSSILSIITLSGSLFQATFGLLTCILFIFLKADYYSDDGINREDDKTADAGGLMLYVSFILWCISTALATVVTIFSYYHVQKKYSMLSKIITNA